MSDPFTWSIHLGRWAGVQVRIHFLLILFAVLTLLQEALADEPHLLASMAWLALLFLVLVIHELGHRVMAIAREVEPEDVALWPLGNLVSPVPASRLAARPHDTVLVALAGPVVNGVLALLTASGLYLLADAQMVLNPFGNALGGGAPRFIGTDLYAAPLSAIWLLGWFGYINWVLFLANLIPALPLDGGRVLRALVDPPFPTGGRDGMIGPWTARVTAIVLAIAGLIWLLKGTSAGMVLLGLALMVYLYARQEARIVEEGGYLDDGLFGYDFSQGYTSLEAGPATVRPRREGALRRWRQRRSELRRRRQEARDAAEEQRMDEILAKLYQFGRDALTSEEARFLVRVSAKYKNRSRSRS